MTGWTILVDLEAEPENLADVQRALKAAVRFSTGQEVRTRTIQTASLHAALTSPQRFSDLQVGPAVLPSLGLKGRRVA